VARFLCIYLSAVCDARVVESACLAEDDSSAMFEMSVARAWRQRPGWEPVSLLPHWEAMASSSMSMLFLSALAIYFFSSLTNSMPALTAFWLPPASCIIMLRVGLSPAASASFAALSARS
jgi:hypothetical protein